MFKQDEAILRRASTYLQQEAGDEQTRELITDLANGYGKLVRQMGRMIKMGDRMQEELQRCARTDALTGLINRRHFMELANREISRSARSGQPFSLCIIDADHFKSVNDNYGHDAGDAVLCSLADVMQSATREMDVVARIGGEEFVMMLPETTCAEARKVASRLRTAVAQNHIDHEGTQLGVTVSIGITCTHSVQPSVEKAKKSDTPLPTIDRLLQHADIALYAAKKNGRNRVEAYSGSTHTCFCRSSTPANAHATARAEA